ncbi:hypothetical protein BXZ70DRAFT_945297 [Cristinia sonorae]|uniref:Uncharacterized protein n=1 Tax=Cristinia sonorae TaxID=1940300 RepID=A0A8K0UJS3_9AGAR|nr:hypothetical protein BXZ70DRAFT_945297 [Cristinia sonorae]
MPEYVWALHDFIPENPDEVPFKSGNRIEVVEKDDLYQDGWWQGRNPEGVVGLFPKSYTTSEPPASTASTLSFPATTGSSSSTDISIQPPAPAPLSAVVEEAEPTSNGVDDRERTLSQGEQVMKATISDVQKAIEQLGRNDRDGAQSFSFASSHGDYTDRSETETDGDGESDEDGQNWHKDARQKLAERAKLENEERRAKEAAENAAAQATPLRSLAPPIEVELSDESEGEDDDDGHHISARHSQRHSDPYLRHTRIVEEDETEVNDKPGPSNSTGIPPEVAQDLIVPPSAPSDSGSAHIEPSDEFIVPSPADHDESDLPTASARQTTFPNSVKAASPELDIPHTIPSLEATPTMPAVAVADITPHPVVSSLPSPSPPPQASSPSPQPILAPVPVAAPILKTTPSTIRVGEQLPFSAASGIPSPSGSSFSSNVPPSTYVPPTMTPATTVMSFKTANAEQRASTPGGSKNSGTMPSEWSVEEVVEWLRSKNFDEGVCSKFIEQEITGDVLLELDQNVLKTEIGIVAFGKRARIVNAIAELRRPPSVESSSIQQQPTSRSHSISYSHSHTPSMQSSAHQSLLSSPMHQNGAQFSPSFSSQPGFYTSPSAPPLSAGMGSFMSTENSPAQNDFSSSIGDTRSGWRTSDPVSVVNGGDHETPRKDSAGLGLGFPNYSPSSPSFITRQSSMKDKNGPSHLTLSRSDVALKNSFAESPSSPAAEDRGVLSDSETAHVSDKIKRRRLFGRSAESSSLKEKASSLKDSSSRHSKDLTGTPLSGTTTLASEEVSTRRPKKATGGEERKASDRLSLFGNSFSGTLGKSRKPPPRLSTSLDRPDNSKPEKQHSISTFSRIRHPERKGSGKRPSTSDGAPKLKDKKEDRRSLSPIQDSHVRRESAGVLRKRTASTSDSPRQSHSPNPAFLQPTSGPTLKPGKSILEQIGTPDHSGWMRKKGDRYNTWKLRYFVLKGPHLYCLRNDSKAETKIKGYINIIGYKVQADENIDPGRYGLQIVHDSDKTHYFSHDEQLVIREWMKALMKATITRDYTSPVVSSSNIPTIPLTVAQAMNPAPRPPSPTAREATQRAHRRENPNQLSSRDAQILMSLPHAHKSNGNGHGGERARIDSFFNNDSGSTGGQKSPKAAAPPRPSRETRRVSSSQGDFAPVDLALIEWANSHLPESLQMDPAEPTCGGLALLRLAEDIKGRQSSPPVPDSAFPSGPHDDKLDGLFRLFDFLLDNDVKMGSVSINDIRQEKRDKIMQLLRAMKAWEDKRRVMAQSFGKGAVGSGPFMGMAGPLDFNYTA